MPNQERATLIFCPNSQRPQVRQLWHNDRVVLERVAGTVGERRSKTDLSRNESGSIARYAGAGRGRSRYSLPNTKSTTQHPRTCTCFPSRQWSRMTSLSRPASRSGSAKVGIAPKSRESYIRRARATVVSVRHSGEKLIGRKGLPKKSRV